ncbi:4Fe-4S dicluster domain-containing protein [Senegalimassilia faecalis]|uniref:4Fe-4S dicluster domain-containing protein n=1 Tax=Senegalimassilia faecalis TaxID=2509433 RepID=A0A4Q2K6L0_9ACTN|nr:4Fe-4S dicluster domain-containing protein [Senegalimassilia faecalis]
MQLPHAAPRAAPRTRRLLAALPTRRLHRLDGAAPIEQARGYRITDSRIGCGTCQGVCPQGVIEEGDPFCIQAEHCLHCGACYEACPVQAIERTGE